MLRGVNRSIIEINDTGSRYFERVLLFVKPEFSSASTRKLEKEAGTVIEGLGNGTPSFKRTTGIREVMRKRRMRKRLIGFTMGVCFLAILIFTAVKLF